MRKKLRWTTSISVGALIVAAALAGSSQVAVKPSATLTATREETFAKRVFELTNDERTKRGLPALRMEPKLIESARWMAGDFAEFNYFGHIDRLSRGVGARVKSFGYKYRVVAENIAAGQRTPEEVVQAWMDSPGHRKNILDGDFVEVGMAYVEGSGTTYSCYWVQVLGMPAEASKTEKH